MHEATMPSNEDIIKMNINGWEYYNYAAIPTCAPHEKPVLTPINDGSIWKIRDDVLLARWTTNWDCGYETEWWYCIKENPFDISSLKAKKRYEINKGRKNFIVREILPWKYSDELYRVTVDAFSEWPQKYRPSVDEDAFKASVNSWTNKNVFAAFSVEDNELCGYATIEEYDSYAAFTMLRVKPKSEKLAINAAIVDKILCYYSSKLHDGFYICDGARAIRHETAFQDYLEKYFGFRKAYCTLHIQYRNWFRIAIYILYPFRNVIRGNTNIGSKVMSILKMEEIRRSMRNA